MTKVSLAKFRKDLSDYCFQVLESNDVLYIPQPKTGKAVVVLSADEYTRITSEEYQAEKDKLMKEKEKKKKKTPSKYVKKKKKEKLTFLEK